MKVCADGPPLHRHPAVLLLVGLGALTSTLRWLEMLAIAVFVFDRTGSPFLVAFMLLLRMLPLALCGTLMGVLSERASRRAVLVASHAAMTAMTLLVAALAMSGRLEVWHAGAAALLGGVFWATDYPARRTLIGDRLVPSRLAAAMGLDVIGANGSRMLGPVLGGVALEGLGMAGAFALCAAVYGACAGASFAVGPDHRPPRPRAAAGVLAGLARGLRQVAAHRTLAGVLVVTVIFNVFGFPLLSLVPVVARDALALSAAATGGLASVEGAGVLVGALALMAVARERHYRHCYVGGLTLFLASMLGFALAGSGGAGPGAATALAGAALFAAGLGGAGFSTMQSVLVMLCAEPAARPRMMGVLSVCIGTAPLGLLALGGLADAVGAPAAMALASASGLVALGLALRAWPEVISGDAAPHS